MSAPNGVGIGMNFISARASWAWFLNVARMPSRPNSSRPSSSWRYSTAPSQKRTTSTADDCGRNSPLLVILVCSRSMRDAGLRSLQRRDAIDAGEAGDRRPDIAAVEQVGAAHRLAFRVQPRVRLLAVEPRRRVGRKQIGIARDEIVAGAAAVEVGVERGIARAGVEQGAAFETAVDRGGGALELGLPAAGRRGEGNAVVGGLHDAAHGLRAEAQRLRTAVDLDLLDRQRIDRHRVILAVVGHVHGADAVLLHADAEVVEAAQDRT